MSLASKLQALVDGLEDTRQAIEGKGATLPVGSPLGDYPGAVESIESEPWVPMPGPGQLTSTESMFRFGGWPQFLTSVEPFDTSNVTTMAYMFHSCSLLVEVPFFDTSNVTNMSYMFQDCSSLVEVPFFDTSNVTTMTFMFRSCSSLVEVPPFDTSNVTSTAHMFRSCSSLESVPLFDTSNVTTMTYMFHECSSLVEVELSDCSKVTNALNMFGTAVASSQVTSLERLILPGMTRGFNLINTQMGAPALNDFFNSLGTASGSQTINITGAPGAATCDKSIATAKGWTITG